MDNKTRQMINALPPALRNLMLTRTYEEGDCLIWTGATCTARAPVPRCHYDYTGAPTKSSRSMRRIITEAIAGKPLGKMVVSCVCDTPSCVNPNHLHKMTRKGAMQRAAATGRLSGPRRQVANRLGARRRKNKLSDDQVRQILARSGESQRVLAREFGVSRAAIRNIYTGKRQRPVDDLWTSVFMRLAA
jgi:hypothetical protein